METLSSRIRYEIQNAFYNNEPVPTWNEIYEYLSKTSPKLNKGSVKAIYNEYIRLHRDIGVELLKQGEITQKEYDDCTGVLMGREEENDYRRAVAMFAAVIVLMGVVAYILFVR